MRISSSALLSSLPLLAFAGLATAFALSRGEVGPQAAGIIDRPMPIFDLPALPGTDAGLSSAGLSGQVMLVNVWAAWCGACREEHPLWLEVQASSPVPIYGIDLRDAPGAGKLFLAQNGNPYAGTGDDRQGQVGRAFGITGVPETFVVDAEGRLRYRHIGPMTEPVWREVILPLLSRIKEPA